MIDPATRKVTRKVAVGTVPIQLYATPDSRTLPVANQGKRKKPGKTVSVIDLGWVPVGVGQILASYSRYETTAPGNPESKKLALGYVHHLSKRTALYTTWARVKNSGGAAVALNGSVTGANQSSSGLDIGVRHSF